MDKPILNNKTLRYCVIAMLVCAGIVFPFVNNQYLGPLVRGDESYQALSVRFYGDSPLAMLTFYVGNVWCRIFGDTYIMLRTLRSVCFLLPAAMASLYFYRRTRRGGAAALIFAVTTLLTNIADIDIYNWDSGPMPFEAAALISLLAYLHRAARWKIALVGATFAAMVLSRLPSAVVLPLALGVIIYMRKGRPTALRDILIDCGIGLASFALTAFLLILLMKGSVEAYIEAFNTDNIINNHGGDMVRSMIDRTRNYMPYSVVAYAPVMGALLSAVLVSRFKRHKVVMSALTYAFLLTYLIYLQHFMQRNPVGLPMEGVREATVFLLALAIPYFKAFSADKSARWPVSLSVILLFLPAIFFGSDMPVQRFSLAFFLPLASIPISQGVTRGQWRAVMTFYCSLLIVFGVLLADDMRYRYCEMRYSLDMIPRMEHLKALEDEYERWQAVDEDLSHLTSEGADIEFLGSQRFDFEYIYGRSTDKPRYPLHRYVYYDDASDLEIIREYIDGKDAVIVVAHQYLPDDDRKRVDKRTRAFLQSRGFKEAPAGKYPRHYYLFVKNAE